METRLTSVGLIHNNTHADDSGAFVIAVNDDVPWGL
jgi:hypothetical protein